MTRARWLWPASLRARILAILLAVCVVPLVLHSVWLVGTAARSGEALLGSRLEQGVNEAARTAGINWTRQRSEIQDLADATDVRASMASDTAPAVAHAWLAARGERVSRLRLLDADGAERWVVPAYASARGEAAGLRVQVAVYAGAFGARVGTVEATLAVNPLLGPVSPVVAGMVLGAVEPETRMPLLALPFDPSLLETTSFTLGDVEWLNVRRRLSDPDIELIAAAPLTPYVQPFRDAARDALLLLALVATIAVALVLLLTARLTGSLDRLAAAADAVSRGEWDGRVEEADTDELRRLARAFNSMTDSLRSTVAELSDRRALAAVGEFAASLAHEIRNPLTSLQVDLQLVEERLPRDDQLGRETQARALSQLRRLDATIKGALQTARSGRLATTTVDLRDVLCDAADSARAAARTARARLDVDAPATAVLGHGDHAALVQLTLNLLLNAVQAVTPGGTIRVGCRDDGGTVRIIVTDDGRGMAAADLERAFEPLYTTRAGGTGLGLAIARRLARAHGGDIHLESQPGAGTTATLRLPAAAAALQPALHV